MRGRRALGGLPLFGTAAGGEVAGHWISYRVGPARHPTPHHVLLASGHGHWLLVVKLSVALALAGVATLAVRFASRTPPPGEALSWATVRLGLVQAVAFTGMEAVERIGASAPVAGMFAHHLFALGLAVQLLVACLGGAFLVWLSRFVRRVAEAIRSIPTIPVVVEPTWRWAAVPVPPSAALAANGIRGPPRS